MSRTETSAPRRPATWMLPVGATALCIGLFVPWVELRLAKQRSGYTPWDLPVLGWFGCVWVLVLLAAVFLARAAPSRGFAIAAAVLTTSSAIVAVISAFALWRIPRLFPVGFLPRSLRVYAPSLRSGFGLLLVAIGCVLLALWSIRRALVQVEVRHQLDDDEGWVGIIRSRLPKRRSPEPGADPWATATLGSTDEDVWADATETAPPLTSGSHQPSSDDDIWGETPW